MSYGKRYWAHGPVDVVVYCVCAVWSESVPGGASCNCSKPAPALTYGMGGIRIAVADETGVDSGERSYGPMGCPFVRCYADTSCCY